MISAPIPSAPVRSNLRPLQEAIIRWGKSYVSLTMLHFHHNGSHSPPTNSYLLQTIRVYCRWATSQPAPGFSNTYTGFSTESDTLAGKSTRNTVKEKESQMDSLTCSQPAAARWNTWCARYRCAVDSVSSFDTKSIRCMYETWLILLEETALKNVLLKHI